jgi:hydroxymethylpyrimidine/phosphomethylpyrimidine kinase
MSRPRRNSVSALSIAGSDSGGGAGVQADLKTFAAYGVHGLSVITALTAQNTRGVTAIHVPDPQFLRAQLTAVFSDFRISAVKLGMLAERSVIEVVADVLARERPAHVVLDPVMVATSGARLLAEDARDALKSQLLPLATLITPNLPEAELLLGRTLRDHAEAEAALPELLALCAGRTGAVLLKGGHARDDGPVLDLFAQGNERRQFRHARLPLVAHGTGCTLSAAIASNLAQGCDLPRACEEASDFVHGALQHAYFPGSGELGLLDHLWQKRETS